MNTVGFPNLNLKEIEVQRFFSFFGLIDIAWYAVIISIGFILACIYALRRMKVFGLDADRAIDVILAGMVGGIIGARLYYVAFSWEEYRHNLLDIFNTRRGGLAIYGGIMGAVLFGVIMCRIRRVKVLPMLDIASLGFLIGQGIGRWGNFINSEAYGSQTSENYLLGMTGSAIDGMVHPCFLYESVWCLLGFLLLHHYSKRRKFDGEVALLYLVWYGTGRMFIEGLRTDSLYLGNLRVSQVLSALLVIFGAVMILTIRSRIKRNNDPEYLRLYVETEESAWLLRAAKERLEDPKEYARKERARKAIIGDARRRKKEGLISAEEAKEIESNAHNLAEKAYQEEKAEVPADAKPDDADGLAEDTQAESEADSGE